MAKRHADSDSSRVKRAPLLGSIKPEPIAGVDEALSTPGIASNYRVLHIQPVQLGGQGGVNQRLCRAERDLRKADQMLVDLGHLDEGVCSYGNP